MEFTYCIEAKCNKTSGINVEFKGVSDINTALECAGILEYAFPMVDILCEQTGEVMYSRYVATDYFHSEIEMGVAILKAECMCS